MSKQVKKGIIYVAAVVISVYTGNYTLLKFVAMYEGSRAMQRKQAGILRREYNKNLTDTKAMTIEPSVPQKYVYGFRRVGGNVVFAVNSGPKREYLHMCISVCNHESKSIDGYWFNDQKLPPLDANNFVTSGFFVPHNEKTSLTGSTASNVSSLTLGNSTAIAIISVTAVTGTLRGQEVRGPVDYNWSGQTVTFPTPVNKPQVNYLYAEKTSGTLLVRMMNYLGSMWGTGIPLLTSGIPEWSADHVGRNVTWLYAFLKWDQTVFGSTGLPQINAEVRGKLCYDPRPEVHPNPGVTGGSATVQPTGFSMISGQGLTASYKGCGSDQGIPSAVYTFAGTCTGTGTWECVRTAPVTGGAPVSVGWTYYFSMYLRISRAAGGVYPKLQVYLRFYNASSGIVSTTAVSVSSGYTSTGSQVDWFDLARREFGGLVAPVGATRVTMSVVIQCQVGSVYDFDIEVGHPSIGETYHTWDYTENPVLQLCDFLRDWRLGAGSDFEDFNWSEIGVEASVCDEMVFDAAGLSQPRYRSSAVILSNEAPSTVQQHFEEAMQGSCVWAQGRWVISAGRFQAPVLTIDESFLAEDSPELLPDVSRSELVNTITGNCIDPDQSWAEIPVKPFTFDAYMQEDGGRVYSEAFDTAYVTNPARLRRLMKVKLQNARLSFRVLLSCNYKAYNALTTRGVAVNLPQLGITGNFIVESRTFDPLSPKIGLSLKRHDASAFDWNYADDGSPVSVPNTDLTSPYEPPTAPQGLTIDAGSAALQLLADGTVISNAILGWTATDNEYVSSGGRVEVMWKYDTDADWTPSPGATGDAVRAVIGPLQDGKVVIGAVRFITGLSTPSSWAFTAPVLVAGKSAPPATPTGFQVGTIRDGVAPITWDHCPDLDYAYSLVRLDGSSWATAVQLYAGKSDGFDWVFPVVGSHTLRIKHVDTTGNFSGEATIAFNATNAQQIYISALQQVFNVRASNAGVVSDYSTAITAVTVQRAGTDDTANWSLSASASAGITVSLTSGTLSMTAIGDSTDSGFIDVTATRSGYNTLALRIPVTKVRAGATGAAGTSGANVAIVSLYKRATSSPAVPSGTTTFTFATGALTGTLDGWSTAWPSGTDPVYATSATASSTGATDTIASGEWSAPVQVLQNGAAGSNGINVATVYIYQRTTTGAAPTLPSAGITFNFGSGLVSGLNNGWTSTVPSAGGGYLWVSTATASSSAATDTVASGEWAAATLMAQDGAAGAAGSSSAMVCLYKRGTSAPAIPTTALTYTFATGAISGSGLNGWSTSWPSGTDPVYSIFAVAFANGATDSIATTEWTSPVIANQNGLNTATVMLYQRNNTGVTPTLPSTTVTYTFATGVASGMNNGWVIAVPAATGGKYLYVTTAAAVGTGATDTIASGEWAAAQLLAQDGAPGSVGSRGTVQLSRAITGSAWSDTEAATALTAAGYGSPIFGDYVTLYNSSANFSESRAYNGSAWIAVASYLNGSLFISNTITADKIDTRGLDLKDASGNTWLSLTVPLDFSRIGNAPQQGGSNLVMKSMFDDGSPGWWTSAGCSVAVVSTQIVSKALLVKRRGSYEVGNRFPVIPGETLYIFARMINQANAGGYTAAFGCAFNDVSGTSVAWSSPYAMDDDGVWRDYEGTITVPANAVTATPWLFIAGPTGSDIGSVYSYNHYIGRQERGATVGAQLGTNFTLPGGKQASTGAVLNSFLAALGRDQNAPVVSGKSDYVADSNSTGGFTYRVWSGWVGQLYFSNPSSPSSVDFPGIIKGRTYRVYIRARVVGSPTTFTVGIYNNTQATYPFSKTILANLTGSYTVLDLGSFTATWASTDTVYTYMGSSGMSPDGTSANAVCIDWIALQDVNAEDGATVGANWDGNLVGIPNGSIYSNDDATTLGFNPLFSDWTSSYPANWSNWAGSAPTKETSIVKSGKYAVKYVTGGVQCGITRSYSFADRPLSKGTFLSGSFDVYLVARTANLPGILVRLYTNAGLTGFRDTKVQPPSTTTGSWQRVPFTARVLSTERIYGFQIYVMGAWSSFTGGVFTGTVIFDSLRFSFNDGSTDNSNVPTVDTAAANTNGIALAFGLTTDADGNPYYALDTLVAGEGIDIVDSIDASQPGIVIKQKQVDLLAYLAATQTLTGSAYADLPGMSVTGMEANTAYEFDGVVIYSSSAVATGIGLNATTSGTGITFTADFLAQVAGAKNVFGTATASVPVSGNRYVARIKGVLIAGSTTAGVQLRWGLGGTTTNTLTAYPGSYIRFRKLGLIPAVSITLKSSPGMSNLYTSN